MARVVTIVKKRKWWLVALGALAVLVAAVLVPTVQTLPGTSPAAREEAERDTMQVGMDSMMADMRLTSVVPSLVSTNDWGANPTGAGTAPLGGLYIRTTSSVYFYCWDSKGSITRQDTAAAPCR